MNSKPYSTTRILAFVYGLIAYAIGLGGLVYFILFFGSWSFLPRHINSAPIGHVGKAIAINLGLLLLFGIQHTQDRYTPAFYQPFLSDWKNFEAWEVAGGIWTAERAHRMFKEIIGSFEAPPMDDGIREELASFVARRKAEGGAPTDF